MDTFKIIFCSLFIVLISCDNKSENDSLLQKELKVNILKLEDSSISSNEKLRVSKTSSKLLSIIENDTIDRALLLKLANFHFKHSNYDDFNRAIIKFEQTSNIARDTFGIAKANKFRADFFKSLGQSDSSFYYYLKSERLYSALGDRFNLGKVLLNKGEVQFYEGDYLGSELSLTKAYSLLSDFHNKQYVYETLTMIGIVYNDLRDYPKSVEYHKKALSLCREFNLRNLGQESTSLNNLGNVYENEGDYKSAESYYREAVQQNGLENAFPDIYATLIDNIAYLNMLRGNLSDCEDKFIKAYKIRDSLGFTSGKIFTKIHLSEYYALIKDTLSSVLNVEQAIAISENSSSYDLMSSLKQGAKVNKNKASKYSSNYIRINDSLQNLSRLSKDKFARIQFETQEISDKNSELNQKNRNLTWFFSGTVMIGLLLFVIRTQRAKNRELLLKQAQQKANEDIYNLMLSQQNKMEEGRIREKKRIAQELHDGVLGRLFGARLNLDSLNRSTDQESRDRTINYLNELKNIEQDLREISHDLNREKTVLINNFVAILNNLFEEQSQNFEPEVSTSIDSAIQWDEISNNLKINIYRIFQESLQNINKYAKASKIDAKLYLESDNLHLKITDDGLGFAVDKKKSGIGLQNMMSRTDECGGLFDIESAKGKGTTIHIIFPLIDKAQEDSAPEIRPAIA